MSDTVQAGVELVAPAGSIFSNVLSAGSKQLKLLNCLFKSIYRSYNRKWGGGGKSGDKGPQQVVFTAM